MNHVLTRLKGIIFTYLGETEMSEPGLLLQAVDKCVLGLGGKRQGAAYKHGAGVCKCVRQ